MVPCRLITNRHSIRRLHMCANRKFSMSEQFEQAEPSYTSYHMMAGGESTSIPPASPHPGTFSTTATVPRRCIANRHRIRQLNICAKPQIQHERAICACKSIPHAFPSDVGESTSIPPASPHPGTFSTTATVPRRSIANRHSIRRLHMCANRKFSMSEQFEQAEPSYTSYHMMAETQPLYLLLRLMRAHFQLQRRYHADPLLIGTAFVVYICVPIANSA